MRLIIGFLFLFAFTFPSFSQTIGSGVVNAPPTIDLSTPHEYKIADITVSGAKFLDASAILSISGLKIGDKIRIPGDGITNAVKKLWEQGLLGNIEVSIIKVEGENIYLDFYLVERPRLSRFTFKGPTKSEQDDLKGKMKLVRGKIITDAAIKNTQNTIKKFYAEKGFMNANVKIVQTLDTTMNNSVSMVITVNKNKKVKIAYIDIQGNEGVTDTKLKSKMKKTKEKMPARFWSRSKFIRAKYDEDKVKMMEYYSENGYRDAKIISDSVFIYTKPRPVMDEVKKATRHDKKMDDLDNAIQNAENRADSTLPAVKKLPKPPIHELTNREKKKKDIAIIIKLEEGQKYYFRNILWTGNYLYESSYLGSILGIKKGDVYNTKELEKRLNYNPNGADVSSLYMDDGYLFFHIDPVEVRIVGDSIDVEMRVYEGTQATIDKILISGNTKTNDHVIQREIRTYPGDKFSRSDLIRSQRELSQLGYFDPEKIDIQPKPNPAKGTVDIEYGLTEKPSDQLQLSGGYGGYYGVVGSLGLSFNNFSARNIFNLREWNPLPAGDGQRLNLSVQANGPTYQSYSISFTEPWLGGRRPNSLSVSLSHSIQNLNNSSVSGLLGGGLGSGFGTNYNYSYGSSGKLNISNFSVSYGRRLRWPDDYFVLTHTGSYLIYNLNQYNLGAITGNQPATGSFNNLVFTNTLSRNSIDNPTFPRSGSNVSLSIALTPPYSIFENQASLEAKQGLDKFKFVEYHKWMFDLSYFHQLIGKFVLNTRTHLGFLGAYNHNLGISPFERFNVGGNGLAGFSFVLGYDVIAMRGYNSGYVQNIYRGTNPGVTYAKQVFEVRYPITLNPMASIFVLGFFEAGNSWAYYNEYNPFDLKRAYGVGARIFMPAFGLIGLDYGIPMDKITDAQGNVVGAAEQRFMFTIGQQLR
jgi:outer membrane protein insertion porin family